MKLCNTFYTHIVVFLASDCEIRDETRETRETSVTNLQKQH